MARGSGSKSGSKGKGRLGDAPLSSSKLEEHFVASYVNCVQCGKKVERRDSLSDHRLKNSEGRYCRFCKDCKEQFLKAVNAVNDPTGLIFDEGIEVDLGDKDPFFRIRFYAESGELPSWKIVPLDDEAGGLLVFVRRVGSFVQAKEIGDRPHLTCKIVITKKSTRVAFAEPYIERMELKESVGAKAEVDAKVEAEALQCKLNIAHAEVDEAEEQAVEAEETDSDSPDINVNPNEEVDTSK